MRVDNLLNPRAPIEDLKLRVLTQETSAPLGYSSVTDGQIRIASPQGLWVEGEGGIKLDGRMDAQGVISITGLLELLNGSTLTVKGTTTIEGAFTASGTNVLSGNNMLSGPTTISGTLGVTGATSISGDFTSTGNVFLNGPTRLNGNSFVTGTLNVTGATTIQNALTTSGNTDLGGTLTISGATTINSTLRTEGAVTIASTLTTTGNTTLGGNLTISGATTLNNTLTMGGGAAINAGGVSISNNQVVVNAGGNTTTLSGAGLNATVGTFQSLGTRQMTMDEITNVDSIVGLRWLAINSAGLVRAVPQDVGGPMGDLEWPFREDQITDEFGDRIHPITGELRPHNGIDFGIGVLDAEIKAAGAGTVVEVGTNPGAGFGYYIVLEHAGGKRTLYAHMKAQTSYSLGDGVGRGAVVGIVGTTGTSTGEHLHLEVHVLHETTGAWVPVNPRTVIKKPWN